MRLSVMFKSSLNDRENNITYNFDKNFTKDIRMNSYRNIMVITYELEKTMLDVIKLIFVWRFSGPITIAEYMSEVLTNPIQVLHFLLKHNQVFDRNESY